MIDLDQLSHSNGVKQCDCKGWTMAIRRAAALYIHFMKYK
jgi:hypothetical protein